MNNIAKIEKAIELGIYSEPTLAYRVYALITSAEHLAAGADWTLVFSADTADEARTMITTHGFHRNLHMIVGPDNFSQFVQGL